MTENRSQNLTTRSSPSPRKLQRVEQQRGIDTRNHILRAATAEFAEKGFEATSIRNIANRIEIQHALITYHFGNKDALWRAAAEHAFDQIRADWDTAAAADPAQPPLERLRRAYRTLFRYTVTFPEFHRFMRQEAHFDTPRLRWVAETVINPLLARLLPQIEEAQRAGLLPEANPLLFHYMMISLTATLSGFGNEMRATSGGRLDAGSCADEYWALVDEIVFARVLSPHKPAP